MSEKKSLIIIGGGITGLTAGLAWVKNCKAGENPVLVIEKENEVGGYVTSFKRKGYIFDTNQIIPNIKNIVNYLGFKVNLRQFKGYYVKIIVINPETLESTTFKIPSSIQGFEYHLINRFHNDSKEIKRFFKISLKIYNELFLLKYNPSFPDKIKMLLTCRDLMAISKLTFEQYYNRFSIKSAFVREIFYAYAAFSGLPANKVAALHTIGAMFSTLEGAYRPEMGFEEFPKEMKKHFIEQGGEIKTKTRVVKIITEKGKAKGVELENGEIIESDYIITTIDPKVAMLEMLGFETLKSLDRKYAEKVLRTKMSTSSLHISLGLDNQIDLQEMGLGGAYNIITTGGDTFNRLYEAFELDKTTFSAQLFHCGVIVPTLADQSLNTVIIRVVPMPATEWIKLRETNKWLYDKEKNDISDFFIEVIEQFLIPGLSKHIIVKDIATPATFARYSGSPTGSNYDMAPVPENFGKNRLSMFTPVKNLFQPKLSNGIWPSMQSGLQVVDHILQGKIMSGFTRFKE